MRLAYRNLDKYPYELAEDIAINLDKLAAPPFSHGYISWDGWQLFIRAGYAWNGPSGPTLDTPSFMGGSLIHDALYQASRLGLLDEAYRSIADKILYDLCIEDGMCRFRAKYTLWAVRRFAAKSAARSAELEARDVIITLVDGKRIPCLK